MSRLRTSVSLAGVAMALALGAPARAQLICQRTNGSKLSFKLRETCKQNEVQSVDLSTQPAGFLRYRTAVVCLQDAGGAAAVVFPEFQLPPGEWLLQAKADVVNLTGLIPGNDYFRCAITVDGSPADAATDFLNSPGVGNLVVLAHASGGSMVGLSCTHDTTFDNSSCTPGQGAYVENAKLSGTQLKTFSDTPVP
jgi:hypothetical protein